MNGNRFNGFSTPKPHTTKGQLHHLDSLVLTNLATSHLGNVIEGANAEPHEYELFVKRYGLEWRDEENR